MRFVSTLLILPACIALCACNHAPAASPAPAPTSSLQIIPAASPDAIAKADVHDWKNPYLIIRPEGLALLDLSNHEEKKLAPDELAATLAKLPPSAWPYGRVIAVTVNEAQASEDEKIQLRKNRALVAGTLKDLQIYVNWIPWT
ncbi:MAG: hypothetical protein ABSE92_18000 [Terriglobales bacterium]|jgi:hypothetical protein